MADLKENIREETTTTTEEGRSILSPESERTTTVTTTTWNRVGSNGRGIAIILLVLVILAGLTWWALEWDKENNDQANIEEIWDAFPDLSQNNRNAASSTPGFFFGASTSSPPTAATSTTRTAARPPVSGPRDETPRGKAPVAGSTGNRQLEAQTPTEYRSSLGFMVTLPAGWTSDPAQNSNIRNLFFDSTTGLLVGYVSVYPSGGETIDSLEQLIKISPDSANTSRILVDGSQAISYTKYDGSRSVAVLHGNSIYYIHDAITSALNSLRFN